MDSFVSSRCEQCDEDNYLRGGSRCARCLGLSYLPVNDEDNEEESSSDSFEYLVAA
jgi:hypothetical protein